MSQNRQGKDAIRLPDKPSLRAQRIEDTDRPCREAGQAFKRAYIAERRIFETQISRCESHYRPNASLDGVTETTDEFAEGSRTSARNTWEDCAIRLLQLRIDPEDYVHKVFAELAGAAVASPTPRQLIGDNYLMMYREADESAVSRLQCAYKTQVAIATQNIELRVHQLEITINRATASVVQDLTLALSPLFRYCLSASMPGNKFQKLAETFVAEAAIQYVRYSAAYDEVWGDRIPVAFKRRAKRIYERYLEVVAG